ncbi:Hypothetical predicted protein [Paramuricea clavata]|uniref:Uncharacterized protein n=1 Tax=Paramuricea clavata TaxID=317549 RepID=A0A6S7IND2_PARCT|nr:Hypothetical predicted protein [Paramuricea clavata]
MSGEVRCRICNGVCPPARRYVLYNAENDYTSTAMLFFKAYGLSIRRDKPGLSRHCCRNCRNNANRAVEKIKSYKENISPRGKRKTIPSSPNSIRSPPSKTSRPNERNCRFSARSLQFSNDKAQPSHSNAANTTSSVSTTTYLSSPCQTFTTVSLPISTHSLPFIPPFTESENNTDDVIYQLTCHSARGQQSVLVNKKWNSLCHSLMKNDDTNVVHTVVNTDCGKKLCVEKTVNLVKEECAAMCSAGTDNTTLFRKKDVNDICNFSFLKLMDEVNEKTNTLYQIVLAIINLKSAERNTNKSRERKLIAAGMAISLLMKARNKNMSAAQYVVSLLLLKGGMTKMVNIT